MGTWEGTGFVVHKSMNQSSASGFGIASATIADSWIDLKVVCGLGTEMMTSSCSRKVMVAGLGFGSMAGVGFIAGSLPGMGLKRSFSAS